MSEVSTPVTLVTIPLSHYCEKVRWAFQRAGMPYVEEGHVPVFSRLATWRRGKASSVPTLVTPEGLLPDSTAILSWLEARTPEGRRLYPAEPARRREVEELEDRFDVALGPHARRIAYAHVLPDRRLALEVVGRGVPGSERALTAALFPVLRRYIVKGLKIDDAGVARSRQKVDAVFAEVSARLADGRRYLVGDRFTAADLTFASLASPLLLPPEYGARLPTLDELSPAGRADTERYRQSPAGAFAMRLYAEERRAPGGPPR